MCDQFPPFTEALRALGVNDEERGKVLGVTGMTVQRYRKTLPRVLRPFTKRGTVHLLRVLADAVEQSDCPDCS